MPPLIAAVLVGAGLYAGLRLAWRLLGPTGSEPEAGPLAEPVPEKDLGALVRDPATGVYRPAPPPS